MTDDLTEQQLIEQIEQLEIEIKNADIDEQKRLLVRLNHLRTQLTRLQFGNFKWRPIN
jgi:hypothetical protein